MTNLNLKKISYTLIFLTLLILLLYFYKKEAKTEVIFFYPQNCLGSFINPEKAQGEPEVNNPDLINESNSAVYLGGFKEIYCGNFQGPVNEGEIQNITLKFNMVLTDERKEAPIIETTSPKSLIEKIIPSRTIEIINTSTDNTQTDTNEIQKATEEINTDKTETNKETTTTPENSPTTETPQSFFYKLVFAQETQPTANETQNAANSTQTAADETRTNVNDNNSELMRTDGNEVRTSSQEGSYEFASDTPTATSDEIQPSTMSSTTSTETTTSNPETLTTSAPQIFNYFDIFYTLDGETWQYLGSITNHNWQNITFSIPVNDWLTISKIQIKIQSNPSLDNIPYLYLESMSLEVDFIEKQENDDFEEITPKLEEINNLKLSEFDILKIHGINDDLVSFMAVKEDKNYLFLIELDKNKILRLELKPSDYLSNSPLGAKNNFIFWLGEDNKIFAFDYNTLKLFIGNLKNFDPSRGERAVMKINNLDFEIIFDGTNFYFRNNQFGEIFSDENSLALEKFRKNFKLDNVLTKEKLSELGLPVEENE